MDLLNLPLDPTLSRATPWRRGTLALLALLCALLSTPSLAQEILFGPVTYTRTADSPDRYTSSFTAASGPGLLRIVTGDALGTAPVTSATLALNGASVLGPREFSGGGGQVEIELALAEANTLQVELRGAPGSQLRVEVFQAFYEEVPAWRMPELAITETVATPSLVDPGDSVSIAATVENIQRGTTAAVQLQIRVDTLVVCAEPVPPLGPAESVSFSCDWTAATPGSHLVRAELEVPDEAFDGSLTNNIATAFIEVSGAPDPAPRVEVVLEGLDSTAFEEGGSYLLPLRIRNASFANLTNLVVAYFDGDTPLCTTPPGPLAPGTRDIQPPPIPCFDAVESLASGEEISLTVPWSDVTAGTHILSVAIVDLHSERPILALLGWTIVIPDQTLLYDQAGPGQWASIGPKILHNQWTGRITSVAFNPANPLIAYAGATGNDASIPAAAGVWKTIDGGLEWFPVGDRLPSLQIRRLAVDPNHPSIIYAAGPEGLFKSTNSGTNWSLFAAPAIVKDAKLYVGATPSGELLIYAGTAAGLKRYKNADPWSKTSTFADWELIQQDAVHDMLVHPADSSTMYLAAGKSIFRTTVAATMDPKTAYAHWQNLKIDGQGLPPSLTSVSLGLHRNIPTRIYAGIASPGTGAHQYALYRSDDGGDTWSELLSYPTDFLSGGLYNPFLRVVPHADSNLEILYFGGVRLYQFINQSTGNLKKKTFRVTALDSADMKDLLFVPGQEATYYWLADDQGVFRCQIDAAPTLTKSPYGLYNVSGDLCEARNTNLRVSEIYDVDVSRLNPDRIVGGTQDTGTILYQGNPTWSIIKGNDGMYSLFNPYDDTIIYAQHQAFNDNDGTKRTPNSGQDWTHIAKGMPAGRGLDRGFITMAPDYPDLLIGVPDGKSLYFHVSPSMFPWVPWASYPIDFAVDGAATRVLAHEVTPGDGAWWLVGTQKGKIIVPWIVNGSSSFVTVFTHPFNHSLKSLVASPVDPKVIFAMFVNAKKTSIYRIVLDATNPALSTASDITYNFPTNLETWTLCGDPRRTNVVYVGTSRGVMWLDPNATNSFVAWQPFNDGLPLTSVTDLVPSSIDYSVVAATKGRGAWKMIAPQ